MSVVYKHIISLGYFCKVAIELEKNGRRDNTYPFDWVITDVNTINSLIKNKFTDLFKSNLLFRDYQYPYIVKHKFYRFDFYHDFDKNIEIENQIDTVSLKYARRIEKFYSNIHEPCLFIR